MAPFIDIASVETPGTLAHAVAAVRHAVASGVKEPLIDWALNATGAEDANRFSIKLNRRRAMRQRASGLPDLVGGNALFSQVSRALCLI